MIPRASKAMTIAERSAANLISGIPMWVPATFGRAAVVIGYVGHDPRRWVRRLYIRGKPITVKETQVT
jgi:hypothetical protein